MNLSGLKKMMNMKNGWAFVSNPNGMIKKGSAKRIEFNWVETIKFVVMSRLGITHPYHKMLAMFNQACFDPPSARIKKRSPDFTKQLWLNHDPPTPIWKAKPKETLGKDLPSNKD